MMGNDFICPYCKGFLNIEGNIILSLKAHDGKVGLISLSPELGNYRKKTNPTFIPEKGDQTEFFCPVCHSNLAALEFNKNLVKVLMRDDNQAVYEILFSGVEGEHCTYKIKDHDIESYGESSNQYMNYFGEFPKY
ncbi:MAG: hypothetical protein KKB34_19765 [Bacteroidetes bacterium]|nr:hypothetical protein [Bacteroidota bacterium]